MALLVALLALLTPSGGMIHDFKGEVVEVNELSWLLLGMYEKSVVELNGGVPD